MSWARIMRQAWCSKAEVACMQALQRVRPYIAQSTEPEQQQQPPLSSKGAAVFEVALKQDGALSHAGVDTKAADTTDLAAANGDGADALAIDGSGVDCHSLLTGFLHPEAIRKISVTTRASLL